jgi:hypothetical protein
MPHGWTVYDTPPEGVNAPAVVITPRDPYRTPANACNEEVHLALVVLMSRASSAAGVNLLDDAASMVRDAINTGPVMAVVEQVTGLGASTEVGGNEYLTVTLDVMVQV